MMRAAWQSLINNPEWPQRWLGTVPPTMCVRTRYNLCTVKIQLCRHSQGQLRRGTHSHSAPHQHRAWFDRGELQPGHLQPNRCALMLVCSTNRQAGQDPTPPPRAQAPHRHVFGDLVGVGSKRSTAATHSAGRPQRGVTRHSITLAHHFDGQAAQEQTAGSDQQLGKKTRNRGQNSSW